MPVRWRLPFSISHKGLGPHLELERLTGQNGDDRAWVFSREAVGDVWTGQAMYRREI